LPTWRVTTAYARLKFGSAVPARGVSPPSAHWLRQELKSARFAIRPRFRTTAAVRRSAAECKKPSLVIGRSLLANDQRPKHDFWPRKKGEAKPVNWTSTKEKKFGPLYRS